MLFVVLFIIFSSFTYLGDKSTINYNSSSTVVATLELSKSVNSPTPSSGEIFTYTLQYSCASLVDNCTGTVITDPLPPEVEFVGLSGSSHTINEVYDSGSHTVSFTFQNTLTAGSTGEVQIDVRFPNGTTANGTVASNTASMTADNAPSVSSSVDATAFAEEDFGIEKYIASGGAVGGLTTYGFRVCNNRFTGNGDLGRLNITNIYVIDTLPAGAVLVETKLSGGTVTSYDPVTNIIQFTVADLDIQECKYPRITVQFPDPPYHIDTTITNIGYAYGTPLGESEVEVSSSILHGFLTPNATVTAVKTVSHTNFNQGTFGSFELDFEINGTEPFDDFCFTDTIPAGIEILSFLHGGYYYGGLTGADSMIMITYTTNLNGPQLVPGSPFSRYGPTGNAIDGEDDLGLIRGGPEYITSITWCFGDVPAGFGMSDRVRLDFKVNTDAPVGLTTNCMEFTTSSISPTPLLVEDCVDFDITENTNDAVAYPWKRIMNLPANGKFNPGDTVEFNLTIQNSPSATIPLVNPEIYDLLPEELEYVSGSWNIPSWSTQLSSPPIFTETSNYNGTGRTHLSWLWTGASAADIPVGSETNIAFKTVIAEDALAGVDIFSNSYAFTGQGSIGCTSYELVDIFDLNNNGNTTELLCSDSINISVSSLISLESEKLVKGQLDSTYTKFPDVANSVPGGITDYILEIRNLGNIAMDSIIIIDILPDVGDLGVIDPLARDSRWRPNLVSTVSTPPGVTVYYSLVANPCRDTEGFVPTGPVGCTVPNWSTSAPTDLTTVQSLKFDFGSTQLPPQDTFRLSWAMRVPVNVFTSIGAQADSIAWNSFGFIGRRTDTGQYTLPSEPVKVGTDVDDIMTNVFGDFVWEDSNQDGIQNLGEPGINGVRVELYKDNGDGLSNLNTDTLVNFTLTANGGYYLFPNLDDGDYYAVFYKPTAMEISLNDIGGDDMIDSDAIPSTFNGFDIAISPIVTLDNLAFDLSWDLGLYDSTNGAVGDYVWHDINGNGIQDESNLAGINGVQIYLYDNASPSSPVDSFITTNDINNNPGYFLFSKVNPGDYFLELNLPSSVSYTTQGPTGSSDTSDSDFNPTTNQTETFSVTAGNYDNSWDAGLILSGIENCTNGIDDDGDGFIDTDDTDCCSANAPKLSK